MAEPEYEIRIRWECGRWKWAVWIPEDRMTFHSDELVATGNCGSKDRALRKARRAIEKHKRTRPPERGPFIIKG